jgi:TetR/AcrR family transcriptional regulator, hemagglutinin/protease regulatory protein
VKIASKSRRTRLAPDKRRAQLLRCAIGAFAQHGIARATHAHVAARAGVEAALLPIVLRPNLEKLRANDSLAAMAGDFDRAARDRPEVIAVWLDWSTGFRAKVWPRYLLMQGRLHAAVERALARGKRHGLLPRGLNSKAAARLFVGGGHTIALMRFAGASDREIATLIDHLIKGTTSIGQRPAGTVATRE